MTVKAIDHVNINTNILEQTKDFFVGLLGLEVGPRPEFGIPGYWLYSGNQAIVHLVELDKARDIETKAPLDHFAFRIDDYDGMVQKLESQNIQYKAFVAPDGSFKQLFFRDPNNVAIEASYREGN